MRLPMSFLAHCSAIDGDSAARAALGTSKLKYSLTVHTLQCAFLMHHLAATTKGEPTMKSVSSGVCTATEEDAEWKATTTEFSLVHSTATWCTTSQ